MVQGDDLGFNVAGVNQGVANYKTVKAITPWPNEQLDPTNDRAPEIREFYEKEVVPKADTIGDSSASLETFANPIDGYVYIYVKDAGRIIKKSGKRFDEVPTVGQTPDQVWESRVKRFQDQLAGLPVLKADLAKPKFAQMLRSAEQLEPNGLEDFFYYFLRNPKGYVKPTTVIRGRSLADLIPRRRSTDLEEASPAVSGMS
jgi:hypothetical protein